MAKVVAGAVEGLEGGKQSAITLCDLSKAFDCVNHTLLLDKLERYGIRGKTLCLIQSYLKNRQQCVIIGENKSDFKTVEHGVPQGSILGPLLFIVYINDLSYYLVPEKCILFADDTTLVHTAPNMINLNQIMKINEKKTETWFAANYLKLNPDKTQRLFFSSSNDNNDNIINNVKLLGITLDSRLNWSAHINNLSSKLASCNYLLRQLKKVLSPEILYTAYFSLFHSHLTYGVILWGNSSQSIKIFRLQKYAVRILAGAGLRDHCKPLFIKFRIMPLPSAYIYYQVLEIHKNKPLFCTHADIHNYNTRSADTIVPDRFRLTKSQNNSLNINLYNILPANIKNSNVFQFKHRVKNYILTQCFYSINEYLNAPKPFEI